MSSWKYRDICEKLGSEEDGVETALNAHELFWNKSEVWIDSKNALLLSVQSRIILLKSYSDGKIYDQEMV